MPIVIRGEASEIRDAIFAEGTYHAAYEPQRAIRTPRWKYVRRFDERAVPVLPNIDDSPTKDVWLRPGWPSASLLARSSSTTSSARPQRGLQRGATARGAPRSSSSCGTRLERWMRGTGDPLLDGPVAPPPGAESNDPDQRSAGDPVTTY